MVRGFFGPVPYLAFPLYRNSGSGNGTETRHTIYTEDDNDGILYYNRIVIGLSHPSVYHTSLAFAKRSPMLVICIFAFCPAFAPSTNITNP